LAALFAIKFGDNFQSERGGDSVRSFIVMTIVISALLGMGTVTLAENATSPAVNNSAINVRDRDTRAITPGQQSNSKNDLELTRQIRRAVEKDDSLSMQAHNVKIISMNGIVTLRGPVKTRHDKLAIDKKARQIAGVDNVNNLLQVETR
jgi:hyperosmotically inducible protein